MLSICPSLPSTAPFTDPVQCVAMTLYPKLFQPANAVGSCYVVAPQYKEPFIVQNNLTMVFVDWSGSFFLNGPLRDYALTENNLRLYSGFHSSVYIPRTSDKSIVSSLLCLCPDATHWKQCMYSMMFYL